MSCCNKSESEFLETESETRVSNLNLNQCQFQPQLRSPTPQRNGKNGAGQQCRGPTTSCCDPLFPTNWFPSTNYCNRDPPAQSGSRPPIGIRPTNRDPAHQLGSGPPIGIRPTNWSVPLPNRDPAHQLGSGPPIGIRPTNWDPAPQLAGY
jgi:hypothetical protein